MWKNHIGVKAAAAQTDGRQAVASSAFTVRSWLSQHRILVLEALEAKETPHACSHVIRMKSSRGFIVLCSFHFHTDWWGEDNDSQKFWDSYIQKLKHFDVKLKLDEWSVEVNRRLVNRLTINDFLKQKWKKIYVVFNWVLCNSTPFLIQMPIFPESSTWDVLIMYVFMH